MKPKPLLALKNFTVPLAIWGLPYSHLLLAATGLSQKGEEVLLAGDHSLPARVQTRKLFGLSAS
jgi:hypothetical protein